MKERMKERLMRERLNRFALAATAASGSPFAPVAVLCALVVWALLGRHYHYSAAWQQIANTGMTLVPFVLLFFFQCSSSHQTRASNLKLDEILRAIETADNRFRAIEKSSEAELLTLEQENVEEHSG